MSFSDLYHAVYCRPLDEILTAMLCLCALWMLLRLACMLHPVSARVWTWINRALCVCTVLGILLVTVLSRSGKGHSISFELFRLPSEPGPRDEYPRMLLMNAFLFLPLGMSLGSSWNHETSLFRSILYTALGGLVLTLLCELLQLVFGLGTPEADDVVMNLSGTLLGMTHLPAAYLIQRLFASVGRKSGRT